MRVLMIYSTSNLGGAELYAVNLIDVLQDDVSYTIASPANSFLGQTAKEMGCETVDLPITYPKFDIADLMRATHALTKAVDVRSFDLIHSHHLPAAMIGHMVSQMTGIPHLFTIDSPYLRPPYKDFMRFSNCYVMSASTSGHDLVLKEGLTPPERLFTARPGVNLEAFHAQKSATKTQAFARFALSKQPTIGVAARLVKDKGVEHVIRAIHILKSRGTLTAKLLIAGDGEERDNLEWMVRELRLGDDVLFMGQVDPPEMPDFYQMMDVFVLATNREGCPITVLEAISSRVPIVATAVGDIPFLVHSGKNGYTIDKPDAELIAHYIYTILSTPGFIKQTQFYNQPIIAEFDHRKQAHTVLTNYQKILAHNGGTTHG